MEYKVQCLHPVRIVNPRLVDLCFFYKHYTFRGVIKAIPDYMLYDIRCEPKVFVKKLLHHANCRFDAGENGFNIVDVDSGELYPVFIDVPCGKCTICKHRKVNDYVIRAVAESQTSVTMPLFITLTYDNEHLPVCGLLKSDVQKWFKRLRISLTRDGIEHNIRYVIVGEYGRNTKRAHYHAILWNFPLIGNKLGDILEYIKNTWQQGFCYVRPCDKGAVVYTMKYMSKNCSVPEAMNPCFMLSSRRHGGIGFAWLQSVRQFYIMHPDCLDVDIIDKFTGTRVKGALPAYFRRKLAPTRSVFIPKFIKDAFYEFDYLRNYHKSMCLASGAPDFPMYLESQIVYTKYRCFPRLPEQSYNWDYKPDFKTCIAELDYLLDMLINFDFDCSELDLAQAWKEEHLQYLAKKLDSIPERNLISVAERYEKLNNRITSNEVL